MTTGLEQFTLDFFVQHEALVERPAFGIVEVLLPEIQAQRLACDSYLRLTFSEETAEANAGLLHLTIGHPLVERIIEAARQEGQASQWSVQAGRLKKPDLFDVLKRELFFPNAWLTPENGAMARAQLHYYARFNFKVAFVSDEKQEIIVSQWMDVNRGIAASTLDIQSDLLLLSPEPPPHLSVAALQWATDLEPLSFDAMSQVLDKASHAVAHTLGPRLEQAQRRSRRLLELDLARLISFYDETEHDLERRLRGSTDENRAASLRSKLALAQIDRQRKLADVQEKHRLRLSLDLVNVALVAQPKLALRAWIENRYQKLPYDFIWDPVLHTLEAPLCVVCQRPFTRLHLCANGHLMCDAHTHNCDLCKREFCGLCQDQMGACATCGRTICPKSQIRCKSCAEVYCADHQHHPHG